MGCWIYQVDFEISWVLISFRENIFSICVYYRVIERNSSHKWEITFSVFY